MISSASHVTHPWHFQTLFTRYHATKAPWSDHIDVQRHIIFRFHSPIAAVGILRQCDLSAAAPPVGTLPGHFTSIILKKDFSRMCRSRSLISKLSTSRVDCLSYRAKFRAHVFLAVRKTPDKSQAASCVYKSCTHVSIEPTACSAPGEVEAHI